MFKKSDGGGGDGFCVCMDQDDCVCVCFLSIYSWITTVKLFASTIVDNG